MPRTLAWTFSRVFRAVSSARSILLSGPVIQCFFGDHSI